MADNLGGLTSEAGASKGKAVGGHPGPHKACSDQPEGCLAATVGETMEVAEDVGHQ